MKNKELSVLYLIDDDKEIRDSLTIFFNVYDYNLVVFESALDYLDQVSHLDMKGCLISDISMEKMDGLELQRRLNKLGCIQPTIFITGHGDVNMAVKAMKLGAFDFIQKPFNPESLLEKVVKANKVFKDKLSVLSNYQTLTNRERSIFEQIVLGSKNKNIAEKLYISIPTVEAHRSRVMKKMKATSLPDLVKMSTYIA
ncbi:MAG: response regulator [Candidatus Thioglobus sp.]|nr:response regulator [Candidatus Thioglobus sp.]